MQFTWVVVPVGKEIYASLTPSPHEHGSEEANKHGPIYIYINV